MYNVWVRMDSSVLQVRATPADHFTGSPNCPFAIAGATFQPRTLFSIAREGKAVSPGRELMKISPRSSSKMGDRITEKLNIYQHSLSGCDRWDIIIYYEYFNI